MRSFVVVCIVLISLAPSILLAQASLVKFQPEPRNHFDISSDGRYVFYVDKNGGNSVDGKSCYLCRFDSETGVTTSLMYDNWGVGSPGYAFSGQGRWFARERNVSGGVKTQIQIFDLENNTEVKTDIYEGIGKFGFTSDHKLLVYISRGRTRKVILNIDLATGAGQPILDLNLNHPTSELLYESGHVYHTDRSGNIFISNSLGELVNELRSTELPVNYSISRVYSISLDGRYMLARISTGDDGSSNLSVLDLQTSASKSILDLSSNDSLDNVSTSLEFTDTSGSVFFSLVDDSKIPFDCKGLKRLIIGTSLSVVHKTADTDTECDGASNVKVSSDGNAISYYSNEIGYNVDGEIINSLENSLWHHDLSGLGPSINLTSSSSSVLVGEKLQISASPTPVGEWKLYVDEKLSDGSSRIIEGIGSTSFLNKSNYKYLVGGKKKPFIEVNGERSYILSDITAKCYEDRSIDVSEKESHDDCDGDGLLNSWEVEGGTYVYKHPDGRIENVPLSLDELGSAGIRHKDILVEVDFVESNREWKVSRYDTAMAMNRVEDLFRKKDINLVFLTARETWNMTNVGDPCDTIDNEEYSREQCLDDHRIKIYRLRTGVIPRDISTGIEVEDSRFCEGIWGTSFERDDALGKCRAIQHSQLDTRRHMIIGPPDIWDLVGDDVAKGSVSGVAVDGYGYVVRNGRYALFQDSRSSNIDKLEATILHELGHTLGLSHGGGQYFNCKPNYLSVMNYLFQLDTSNRPIDLSHSRLETINPLSFNEEEGLKPFGQGDYVDSRYKFRWGISGNYEILDFNVTTFNADTKPLDYNRNLFNEETADITLNAIGLVNCTGNPYGKFDLLEGYDDWDSLALGIDEANEILKNRSGGSEPGIDAELYIALEEERLNLDEDADGVIGIDDNCPYEYNPNQADDDGDGVGTSCDVCPYIIDSDQLDTDADGLGDACDQFTGAESFTIPFDQWLQFGVPLETGSRTLAQIFGSALPVEQYQEKWVVFRYSGSEGSYSLVALNESLDSATGYWIMQSTGEDVIVSLPAALLEPDQFEQPECATSQSCIYRELAAALSNGSGVQWDMISSGLSTPINVSDLGLTFAQNGGYIRSAISSDGEVATVTPIYVYSDGAYEILTSEDELYDWQGGWVGVTSKQPNQGFGLTVSRQQ